MNTVLVTGVAGFIGSKVAEMLLENKWNVLGIDNLNHYYDIRLKEWHLNNLKNKKHFKFYQIDIEDINKLRSVFEGYQISTVINLAARAGVRSSIENPFVYQSTNIGGNQNLLELCREFKIEKYILSSTSSLYAGEKAPFKESLPVNSPISPYAATKKAAEALSYTYHYLYGIDVTILRYFTVYGPAGRPDMSPFRFIKRIIGGIPITIYGDGSQQRDFTYIDDIASGTIKALNPLGYEIINLGNNHPYKLIDVLKLMERYIGKKAIIRYKEFHKADMLSTWADIKKAKKLIGWQPRVDLEEGLKRTIFWMKENWDLVKDIN